MQEKNGYLVYKRKHYTASPRDLKFKFVVPRVLLEAAVRKCSSKQVLLKIL